jgi:FAD/FMN-containing dehydrogenase
LTLDNLEAATIILADGSIKEVSETSNSDLFWAIRGAGTNFAVVYEFVFRAHEQKNNISAGMLIFPIEKLTDLVNATSKWAKEEQTENDLILIEIAHIPPEFKVIIINRLW